MAGREVLVAGSIGPLGTPTRDLASHDEPAIRAAFREQVEGLLEGGVDLFVLDRSPTWSISGSPSTRHAAPPTCRSWPR